MKQNEVESESFQNKTNRTSLLTQRPVLYNFKGS